MRRTDFCLLTSSYEHPCLVGSQAFLPGESPGSRQVWIRFGGPQFPVCRSSREALSSSRDVCGRASDISVAIPTPGPASLARLVPCPRPAKTGPRSTA